jgi:hypothetical protein
VSSAVFPNHHEECPMTDNLLYYGHNIGMPPVGQVSVTFKKVAKSDGTEHLALED